MHFYPIFEKDIMSHRSKTNILLNSQVRNSMYCNNTSKRFVNSITSYIRLRTFSIHMKVYRISSQDSRLTSPVKLRLLYPTNCSLF